MQSSTSPENFIMSRQAQYLNINIYDIRGIFLHTLVRITMLLPYEI